MVRYHCCQEQLDDSEDIWCNGPSHPRPRLFHSECMNAEDISQDSQNPWICYQCKDYLGYGDSSPLRPQSPVNDSQLSTQSDAQSEGKLVVSKFVSHDLVRDKYFGTKRDLLMLEVEYEPTASQVYTNSSKPFFLVEIASVEKAYFESW